MTAAATKARRYGKLSQAYGVLEPARAPVWRILVAVPDRIDVNGAAPYTTAGIIAARD